MGPFTRAAALATLGLCLVVGPASAQSVSHRFTVDTTRDVVDNGIGDGFCRTGVAAPTGCSLRAAIQEANFTPAADVIVLPANANPYGLTISSGSPEDLSVSGDLDVTNPLTIEGGSARGTVVQQTVTDRVFDVRGGRAR